MKKPTDDILGALVRLKYGSNKGDFDTLLTWMRDSLFHMSVSGTTIIGDVESRWSQGKCQNLRELLDYMDKADEILKAKEKR